MDKHQDLADKNIKNRKFIALVLIGIAVMITCFDYDYTDQLLKIIPITRSFEIKPTVSTVLYALVFYSAFVVRWKGIHQTVGNVLDIISVILITLLIASLFRIIINGFFGKNADVVLAIAIIMSWLGIKLFSLSLLGIVGVATISHLHSMNKAIPFLGIVYLFCAYIGILLWFSTEPACNRIFHNFGKVMEKNRKS